MLADLQQQENIKTEIAALTGRLNKLRREVRLCEDIAVRSTQIKEKMKAVREGGKSQGKEKEQHELFRRRG